MLKVKKEKKNSITLDENDNENSEINIHSITEIKISSKEKKSSRNQNKKNNKSTSKISDEKNNSKIPNKKSISKILDKKTTSRTPNKIIINKSKGTPNKIIINKSKDNADAQNKKNRNNEKINKKNKKNGKNDKEEEIIQCQLSEESEDEINQRSISRNQKGKKSNKRSSTSKDKSNSNCLSTQKSSQKRQKNSNEYPKMKSKSTVKVSYKNEAMKEKINNFLGRKRKQPDNQKEKSKTPNKKQKKSDSTPIKKYPKQKNKAQKTKSRTPLKYTTRKNIQNNNLYVPKMDIDDYNSKKKKFATPELAILNHLIQQYGFEKVLDTLCKPNLDSKIKIDSCLQGLKDSCTNEKLPILLVKMLFSYFESKFNDKITIQEKKRSTSAKKSNTLKNYIENSEKSPKFQINEAPNLFSMLDSVEGGTPIQIEDIQEIKDKNDKNELKKLKNKAIKSPIKEEEVTSIGSHYNKSEEGEIFKYQISSLDGKGKAIFKCYDDKCNAMGIYELESMKFSMTKKHNLKHAEHEYIMNYDKEGDTVFKELIESEKSDAQVFKENGERVVKFY